MMILVDAQCLIWYVDQDQYLSAPARGAISDPNNELVLSAATIWEIGIKVGLGKLKLSSAYRDWMLRAMSDLDLRVLPITIDYSAAQASLPWHHRDPFDRLLVAQSLTDQLPIVSADTQLDHYGITRIW